MSGRLEQTSPSAIATIATDKATVHRPNHVAIIMDGNGRWAASHGKNRLEGHRAGTDNIRRVIEAFAEHGVKYLTLFAFSTENWDRPNEEVQGLIDILQEAISRELDALNENGVRLQHLGRLDRLPPRLQNAIRDGIEITKDNRRITLSLAFDYGGRAEILDAVRRIVADELSPADVTEEVFRRYLHNPGLPDADLIIRTGGEMRLSNFLLWQSYYAEYYSTAAPWPDFDEHEAVKALAAYGCRQRRFGKVV